MFEAFLERSGQSFGLLANAWEEAAIYEKEEEQNDLTGTLFQEL